MKSKEKLIGLFGTILLVTWSSTASAQQQPVTGFYDSTNDWFVFQWVNPKTGNQQAIYDSTNKVNPVVNTNVSVDGSGSTFTYTYQVTNQPGARQVLGEILIQHLSTITDVVSPLGWHSAEYKGKSSLHWTKTVGTPRGIPAGQTVPGFSFQSGGLPTIVVVGFGGKRRMKYTFPSPDDDIEAVQSSYQAVFQKLQAQYPTKFVDAIQQKTIGPVDPPPAFDAITSIQNLISLKEQSLTQGWIDNQGIATSLDAKLNAAKAKIAAGDNTAAKNIVGAFLNDVRAQNGKHLSAEAYALLYYNGQYLVNHL